MDKKGNPELDRIKQSIKEADKKREEEFRAKIKVGDKVIRYYSAGAAGSPSTHTNTTKILKTGFRVASHPKEFYNFDGSIKRSQKKRRDGINWGIVIKVIFKHGEPKT